MPIHVNWDNDEKTIVRYDFVDPWTWTEFFDAIQSDDSLLAEADHTVHLLFNTENLQTIPPNPIARFRSVASMVSPNLGLVVVAGHNQWFQKLGQIFYNTYGRKLTGMLDVKIAATLEEGRHIIQAELRSRK